MLQCQRATANAVGRRVRQVSYGSRCNSRCSSSCNTTVDAAVDTAVAVAVDSSRILQ